MHTTAVLLSLVAAGTALEFNNLQRRELQRMVARQTPSPTGAGAAASGTDSACLSALESLGPLLSSVPTPPADLVSFEMTAMQTDACSLSIPASLQAEFSSYEQVALSWYSSNSASIQAALASCPADSSSLGSLGSSPCTGGGSGSGSSGGVTSVTTAGGSSTSSVGSTSTAGSSSSSGSSSGSGSSGSSGSGSSSSGSSPASTSTSHAGAPQQTAFISAAMLAAGFLGAVAAL